MPSSSKTVEYNIEAVDELDKIPLRRKDFIEALKGINWLIETQLNFGIRYLQYKLGDLRRKGVDAKYSTKIENIENGVRLVIDVTVDEDTVILFAKRYWMLDNLLRRQKKSLKRYPWHKELLKFVR